MLFFYHPDGLKTVDPNNRLLVIEYKLDTLGLENPQQRQPFANQSPSFCTHLDVFSKGYGASRLSYALGSDGIIQVSARDGLYEWNVHLWCLTPMKVSEHPKLIFPLNTATLWLHFLRL